MELSSVRQAVQLCAALAFGAALGLCYDFLRILRRRCKRPAGQLTDAVFWLLSGFGLFVFGMAIGDGELRLFMIIGAGTGTALYMWAVSPTVTVILTACADLFTRALNAAFRPIAWLSSAVKRRISRRRQ